jgi:hypothetical protein
MIKQADFKPLAYEQAPVTFVGLHNEMINRPSTGQHNRLCTVGWDSRLLGFRYHSVGVTHRTGMFSAVHGVTVEPRFVWAAIYAFNESPSKAVFKDGREVWCGTITKQNPDMPNDPIQEIRLGAEHKYGPIASVIIPQKAWVK